MENDNNNLIIEGKKNDSSAVSISPDKLEVKKHGSLVIGTLNLALNPLKKRNELYYRGNPWYLIVDILLLFLLAGLALFIFSNTNWGPAKRIDVSVSTNTENISSGSSISFDLNYRSYVEAEDTMLYLSLPDNFIIESTQPANLFVSEKNAFNLGHIEDGMHGKIKINGLVWSDTAQQKINFNFKCSSCGKNGVNNTLLFNIDRNALNVDIKMDDKIYANSEFESQVILKNNTNNNIKDIVLDFGPDLEIKRSDKNISDKKIKVGNLSAGEEVKFNFSALAIKEDSIKFQTKVDLNINENNFSFLDAEKNIEIRQPDLSLEIKSDTKSINNGEKVKYAVNCSNKGESAKDIVINLSSNNPNFSLKSVQASKLPSGVKLEKNILSISSLNTEESSQFELEAVYERRQFLSNQEVSLKAELNYQASEQKLKHTFISTKNRVNSQISALANAYYYSPQGDQLGVGPLPPVVDMATKYWIFLELNVLGNDLSNASLSAELPNNVYFSNNKRVLNGDLKYGEIGKRLIWELDSINGSANKYRADFEVSLIPEQQDLGKILNLLENIEINVKDNFTGENISLKLPNINTNLKNDKLSSGRGRVVSF